MSASSILFGLGPLGTITKRRVFVSYHHGNDQQYYNKLSEHFSSTYDIIQDNSLDREIDSDDNDYVMRKIREDFISGTSCTIVLCGAETPNRKFVDWEIKATLDKQHALIGVYLPTAQRGQSGIIVPDRFHANYQAGFGRFVSWESLFDQQKGLKHIVEEAVQHAQANTAKIDNSAPLLARNKTNA